MEAQTHPKLWDVSTAALVLANAVPIGGVLFFHWEVFPLLLLYWLENIVVGIFNLFRLALAYPSSPSRWAAKLFFIPVFCLHFGLFTGVHGSALFAFFRGQFVNPIALVPVVREAVRQMGMGPAVLSIIASHGISFIMNYLHGGEYRRASPQQLLFQPYRRVAVFHLTILGSALPVLFLGSPLIGLVLLVALKTGVDVIAHRAERRKFAAPQFHEAEGKVDSPHASHPMNKGESS